VTKRPSNRDRAVTSLSQCGIVGPGGRCYPLGVRPKILVVDDEPEAVELVAFNVTQAGFEVNTAIPIVMVTAKAAEIDRILGLELGADDYITKPFSPRELVLRIKNILARGRPVGEDPDVNRFGDLVIDAPRHLVSWRGRPIELTATEFKLLALLAQRRGRVQSREQLLRDVWEYNSLIDTRTVDTHMRRLREKLGPAAKHLATVRGVGYRFVEA